MMREVFLDELPRWGKSGMGNEGMINWKESEGYNVKFVYDDIKGFIKIINYNTESQKLTINYNDKHLNIYSDGLKKCKIGNIVGKYTNRFKINIGESFEGMLITDRQYRYIKKTRNEKWYKYTCNKCGWTEGWIVESNLKYGKGCSCCGGKTVVEGINDICTTAPWMIDLGVDKEEAKKFTKGSSKKIKCICPYCKKEFYKQCRHISRYKSICCTCGDGFSYPEKFMYSALKQLGIEFKTQYSPTWVGNKFYDFYVPSLNIIIETHGEQHYIESGFKRTLDEEQENDRFKRELASSNGINNYIELDCRNSEIKWIKNSITNSELSKMFDLSNIDWLMCGEFAIKSNMIKEVCNYWNNKKELETTTDLEVVFGVYRTTIIKYLKQGAKLGWCNYDAKEELRKNAYINGKNNSKMVEIFKDGVLLGVFDSCCELARRSEILFGTKLLQGNISMVCLGNKSEYKGYTFQYI